MKNIKSLKSQLVLQFAIIILPVITILLYQTVSDIYQDEQLARSYHYLNTCHGIKLKYTQFINGAVLAVDSGQLGMGALRDLEESTEKLRNLAQEDDAGNFVTLQGTMDTLLTALSHDRSITTLMALRELINRADAELGNEYLRYEKESRQAIEANIAFAKTQKITVLAAVCVTFLLSMFVGRLMTRSITGPITEAVTFAQSIILDSFTEPAHGTTPLAQKELTTQGNVKATGEVQILVDSINRMAENLGKRTHELLDAQEELVRKEKLAMLGRIAGNMGNELRNPLGVMSNAVFFLQTVLPDADETVAEYLEIIVKEIDSSRSIISDLCDFCSASPPRKEPVSVHELIRQSRDKCTLPENIGFQADLAATLPQVQVDPLQMGQVIRKLISNAVQAMPDGGSVRVSARKVRGSRFGVRGSKFEVQGSGKDVELRTLNVEPDADFVEISIVDSGVGIAAENLEKLFQPLFSTRSRGIGLGLAISRKLIEANGGRIGVESELGKGTTFTLMLPVNRSKT